MLLYELLCGSRPYRFTSGSPVDVITLVCDRDPEPPSMRATRSDGSDGHATPEAVAQLRNTSADRLARLLDGDLDSIVLMAMRKEPGRRYQSADMLGQDVERYLAGLPVVAHQGSRRYRTAKFLRRHRVEAAATAVVLVALIAGLTAAVVLIHLSWVYRDRSDFEPARRLVDEALRIRRATLPADHPDIGDALAERGRLAYTTEQEGHYRQALATVARTPAMAERRVTVLQQLSTNLRRQGRLAEAVATDREALALAQRAFGPEHQATGYAMIHLGDLVRDIEDPAGAEHLYRRGLELMIRHYGGNRSGSFTA